VRILPISKQFLPYSHPVFCQRVFVLCLSIEKKKVKISSFIESGRIEIFLDGEIVLKEAGEYEANYPVGREYCLNWKATAIKKTVVRVTVHSPDDQQYSEIGLVGESGVIEGSTTIST
jgi:hypothetical protein